MSNRDQRYQDKYMDEEDPELTKSLHIETSKPSQQNTKSTGLLWILFIIILVLLILYIILVKFGLLNWIILNLEEKLSEIYKQNKILVCFILTFFIFLVVLFALPFHMIFCILTTIIIRSFWISFILLLFGSVLGSFTIFFFSKWKCRQFLLKYAQQNDFYEILLEESQKSPWTTAILSRIIFIPAGLKDYILSLIENPFKSYLITAIIVHSFFIAESVLIALEFEELENYFKNEKSWNEKSFIQKLSMILVAVLIILTLVILIWLGCWASKKLEYKKRQRNANLEIVNVNQNNN